MPAEKSDAAFRTIGELSAELGVPPRVLRYWETRFPELKPLQRSGNRRYYRPDDVTLARRIHRLLGQEGYTVRGVQQLLREKKPAGGAASPVEPILPSGRTPEPDLVVELRAIRARLAAALDGDSG